MNPRRPLIEQLEERTLLSINGISSAAYNSLSERVTANEEDFFVYQDADSAFNHGFPSGIFAGADTPQRVEELIGAIEVDPACVDDPSSATGCSTDPSRMDRERGNVARITLPPISGQEYVGINFEEPEDFGSLGGGVGYNLTGADRVVFDARSTVDGLPVYFGVGGKVTDFNNPYALDDTFQEFSIELNTLRDPVTNQPSGFDLSNVQLLFSVSTNAVVAPSGGTVLLDNIRFEPLPVDPLGGARLSFPLGNETFGVVPVVIHAVDDGAAGFSATGTWTAQADGNSYQSDHQTATNGGNSATATWTIPDLEPRDYVVQATWPADATNATNARFEVLDGGTSRTVTLVDQTSAPAGSMFDNAEWQTVGSVSGDEIISGTLNVVLSNSGADGTVIADAIRIVPTVPPDQAIRNLATVYESALTVFSLLERGTAEDLKNAKLITDTFLYALDHDNTGGGGALPATADAKGLRDSYSSGDIGFRNSQSLGGAQQDEARLAGFTSDTRLCGDDGFCLVLDGAFGGNNAFGIMALMAAYSEFHDMEYLAGARKMGNWIYDNLKDPNGPAFDPVEDPGDETFGGYFLGYGDQGVAKTAGVPDVRGKSIENNADVFAAFMMLGAAEHEQGDGIAAAEWERRAKIAGDFVMAMYDPGHPIAPRDGHFYTGTIYDADGPGGDPPLSGAGLEPGTLAVHQKGTDVINVADVLDSNTFTTLALARSPEYRNWIDLNGNPIDWREPVRYVADTFQQEITSTTGGESRTYRGFNIVPKATGSQFRPGGPVDGLPEGIAWEFTAQVVNTMEFVDWLYGTSEFEQQAAQYLGEIQMAQWYAPFGDGMGLVAATLDGEDDDDSAGHPPLDQCLGTPFQCIAERVGLAATNWAIYADQGINIFSQQIPLPMKTAAPADPQVFMVDDFDNKITQTDVGFNYFGGNSGALNDPEPADPVEEFTTLKMSNDSNGTTGGSLRMEMDFTKQNATDEFGGFFTSLFGLTDTLAVFEPGLDQADATKQEFDGYFLDFDNLYGGLQPLQARSIEAIAFDARLETGSSPFTVKVELKDEGDRDVFTRTNINSTNWTPISIQRSGFNDSVSGGTFNWNEVSGLSIIVERENVGDGISNPDTGTILVDNIRLLDTDGDYPDFGLIEDPNDGGLLPQYEDAFLDHVRATSSQYFLDFASTDSRTGGIIQDRSTFADLMTVGGVGFQLTSYVIGAERGYLSRDDAAHRVHDILDVLANHPQGPDPVGQIGNEGFFYHFLGVDGLRKQNFDFEDTSVDESLNTVELSTIDTALAVAGVVTAGQYFDADTAIEEEIRVFSEEVYGAVNWPFMLNTEPGAEQNQFFLGWKPIEQREGQPFEIPDAPEDPTGHYSGTVSDPATVDFYTDEGLLIALLAMGSPDPDYRLGRDVWDAMIRDDQGGSFVRTFPGSLFTYEFASIWLDTEALGTDNHQAINGHPARPTNFFNNSRDAILATRNYAIANPNDHVTLQNGGGAARWGLSAAEGPFDDYFAYAAPPAALADDGGIIAQPGTFMVEAENGTGDGSNVPRGNSSGGLSVQLDAGETRTVTIDVPVKTEYEVVVRYSNDNFGPLENVEVSLDGNVVGSFFAQDTGDSGTGWDVFVESDPLGPITLWPGEHEVTISISGGDGFGVEIDKIILQHELVLRPLEDGTATIYGAGSAIQHVPQHATAALWEARELDLLHPRFGFADAFNLDIADAVLTETVGGEILRTTGPWANFNGFAIDHGPMLAMIDNHLEDNFVPSLFMSHPTIAEALKVVNGPDHEDAPFLGWNYVSFNSGDLPVTTSWVLQDWPGSDGLSNLQITNVARNGGEEGVLRADASLFRDGPGDEDPHRDGEVFVDLRYRFHHPKADASRPVECGFPLRDLEGARITAEVRLGPDLLGDPAPPAAINGTQILLKSLESDGQGNETWRDYYGPWNETTSEWQTIVLDLSTDTAAYEDPDFNASEVGLLGIKVGTNSQVIGTFEDSVDVAFVRIDYADGTFSEWTFENTDDSITRMVQTGANTVALVDHWFVDSLTATDIHPDPFVTHQYPGSPMTAIEDTIDRLHAEGLAVHLKPHLDLAGFDYADGEWRGKIRPSDADIDAFFQSYEDFIGFYAVIAEQTGAEGLVVETELNALDSDDSLAGYWADIIASLKQIYSGDLIVAANWDSYQDNTLVDLVDLVGIDAYFPLTDSQEPCREDLMDAWRKSDAAGYKGVNWAEEISAWSTTTGKPFYFTEFGIQSRDGAAAAPGSVCEQGTAQYNAAVQVAHYEAALEVFSQNENFAGLLGWAWYPWSDAGGDGDIDFTPQNKLLETAAHRLFQPSPWQNGFAPEDINGNGEVTSLDVLILIVYISGHPNDFSLPTSPEFPPPHYDVNGDGQCTSLDILQVINCINICGVGSGVGSSEGEGRSPAIPAGFIAPRDIGQQASQASPDLLNDERLSRWHTGPADMLASSHVNGNANAPSPWATRFVGPSLTRDEYQGDDGGIRASRDRWLLDDFAPHLSYLDSILPDIAKSVDRAGRRV